LTLIIENDSARVFGQTSITFAVVGVVSTEHNVACNISLQTGILIVLCFIGDLSERSESKVRDLDDPATVQQTVGALQTTVKLQLTFVNVFHSLSHSHRSETVNRNFIVHR